VVAQPSWTSLIKENDQGNLLKITDDAVALINGRKDYVCYTNTHLSQNNRKINYDISWLMRIRCIVGFL
jgi:hypothetical protein